MVEEETTVEARAGGARLVEALSIRVERWRVSMKPGESSISTADATRAQLMLGHLPSCASSRYGDSQNLLLHVFLRLLLHYPHRCVLAAGQVETTVWWGPVMLDIADHHSNASAASSSSSSSSTFATAASTLGEAAAATLPLR